MSSTLLEDIPADAQANASRVTAVYTICPVFVASHVAVELGWLEEELKRVGAGLAYLRSLPENIGWLPHFSHRRSDLFRDGGNIPAIWARADRSDTKLLGLTWSPAGGRILVRAGSGLGQVADLRGRRIGLYRSLNSEKVDWWRATGDRAITIALRLAGLGRGDVEVRDIDVADNIAIGQGSRPAELWTRHRREGLAFSPEVSALEEGVVDAIYASAGRAQRLERTGRFTAIEDLSRHPDWTLQIANSPWALTVSSELARRNPEVVIAYLRAAIRAGRWINGNRPAAAEILHRVTYYPEVADVAEAISEIDFIPNLSARNLAAIDLAKSFLRQNGYIRNDFETGDWAAPEFLKEALRTL